MPKALFPAHAGVISRRPSAAQAPRTIPRTRGGDPIALHSGINRAEYSPHTQGYPLVRLGRLVRVLQRQDIRDAVRRDICLFMNNFFRRHAWRVKFRYVSRLCAGDKKPRHRVGVTILFQCAGPNKAHAWNSKKRERQELKSPYKFKGPGSDRPRRTNRQQFQSLCRQCCEARKRTDFL